MSSNWQWLTLGEVVSIEIGRTPSRSDPTMWDPARQSGAVWVSIADLTACEGRVISDSKEYISSLATVAGKPVRAGTLMMSFKLSIGKLAFAGTDLYTNEAIAALTVKDPDRLSSAFLFHFLSHVDWVSLSAGNEKVKGATLNKAKLAVVPVPVPPLAEQKRIVAKLDEVDADLRTLSERLDIELLQSAQIRLGVVDELFGGTRGTPTALGELLEIQNGYAFESEHFSPSAPIGLIRIRDLKRGTATETGYEGAYDPAYLVKAGDLLIGMDGEFRCYTWKGAPALLNQRVCRLHRFRDDVDPRFVFHGINTHLARIEAATGYTTVKHLSSRTIKEITFELPSLPEQQRIVDRVEGVHSLCAEVSANIERRKDKVGELRRSVLAAAFRGDL